MSTDRTARPGFRLLGPFSVAIGCMLVLALAGAPTPATAQSADPLDQAQAAVDAGQPEAALEIVEPILKRDKRNARALLVRSTARCLEGDIERCKKDLDAALEADPNLRQGWLNRSALAISEKRYDDAIAALAEAERIDPTASDNGLNVGAVRLLKGDLEAATADFRRYLARNQSSGEAWFLVATNYAFSGYAALAVEHLSKAIALDERLRPRARVDPNFSDLARNSTFQSLITTDGFQPAPDSLTASKTYQTRYTGADSPILTATLNAIQIAGLPLDPIVDVTDGFAVLWSRFRVKLLRTPKGSTIVQLTAPAGSFAPAQWESRTGQFFADLERELLHQELAKGREVERTD